MENPSELYGMKNSFKNTFPLDKKCLSLAVAVLCKKLNLKSN